MPQEKRKRAYGISCNACREKKVACDGVRPRCGGCRDTTEECQVPASARPLRRLQNSAEIESGNNANIHKLTQQMRRMEDRMRQMEQMMGFPPQSQPQSPRDQESPEPVDRLSVVGLEGAKYRLTVDETGNVVYHGLTGWSHGPNVINEPHVPPPLPPIAGMTDPTFAPLFEALATSKHIRVAPQLGDELLNAYFCYQVFNIIQRSAFTRDMALGGPLFSEFLLMTMYASSTRMMTGWAEEEKRTQGELFERLAKEYLAKEMEGPTKITTIQGLLLLSGRECAMGNVTQGWNHAGSAFRMILDLGIHLAPETVVGTSKLSLEEQATRERLFWSAFIWDKSISLALGREPTFPPRLGRDPSSFPDFEDEQEPWTPYYANPLDCPPSLIGYVYQPASRGAAFRFLAWLCLILHDVINELYSTESRMNSRQRTAFVTRTQRRLDDLWSAVPDRMKFNPAYAAPPPWIFMFQMLYHATSILLHRPVFAQHDIIAVTGPVVACLNHSITANQMSVSFTQTFGDRMAYVAMYSSFVASSFDIVVLDSERLDIQMSALVRLKIWLGMMEKSAIRVPSIRGSVHHILSSACTVASKYPPLVVSEAGQWIVSHQHQQISGISPFSVWGDTGAFDFFELLGPV